MQRLGVQNGGNGELLHRTGGIAKADSGDADDLMAFWRRMLQVRCESLRLSPRAGA
jgi:hypothetical protein